MNLRGEVPEFLTWLRYNTFYVLYPMGIGSEMALVYKASTESRRAVKLLLWDALVLYIPGELLRCLGLGERGVADWGRLVCFVYAYDDAEEEGHERETAGTEESKLTFARAFLSISTGHETTKIMLLA